MSHADDRTAPDALVGAHIRRIAPYEPGKPIEELERELGGAWPSAGAIKLASNENPFGPSPLALEAARAALSGVNQYPDGGAVLLRRRVASFLGVPETQIIAGSGSNELIDLLVQTFCGLDEEVLAPACSFACYRLSAQAHQRVFREAPNGPRLAYDVEALLGAVGPRTKLVFLANPNNPTGAYLGRKGLERLVRELPPQLLLVIDEAYLEYVRAEDYPNALDLLGERGRMVVLRTFSKAYGLAGLRVGYGVSSPDVIGYLDRVRLPFNVALVAQVAARAALDDVEHVARSHRSNAEEMDKLSAGLRTLGLDVYPSQANFLLVGFGDRSGRAVFQALLERGVIVRPMDPYGLPHHLRITIGRPEENQRLLATLSEVLAT